MDWGTIRKEWETTPITLATLADKHEIKLGTLKSRSSREGWSKDATKKDATKSKKVATTSNKVATKRKRGNDSKGKREESRNRSGNPNPVRQFTKRNDAAVTHGLFRRFFPDDTLEIMEQLFEQSPADLIWDQIKIQYAAIIRAQQIMHVTDKEELIKHLKKHKSGETFEEKEWEFQYAWDRQATFLNAQSRAMSELRSLIKQFCEMASEDDERRLKLEQMQLGIEKSKLELTQLRGDTENDAHEQGRSYEEALNAQAEDVFDDEDDDDAEA